jgi:site-specific DNA-methyltransferase (adenine-specific)
MPTLTWPAKGQSEIPTASISGDSIIHPGGGGYPARRPEGRLILGDNLAVMNSLAEAYAGRIDLIYVDPPFFSNRKYPARIGRGEDSRQPQAWALAEGYHDHWPDLDTYLEFLYARLQLMHRLLAADGTLYLHLDWHANSYARLMLDEIFGHDHLLNEIVWTYHGPSPIRSAFNRKHDTILAYVKGEKYTFNSDAVREPYNPSTVQTFLASPKAGFGKMPDLARGKVPEDWWYFPVVARLHNERTGYPTQKPQALLERIIRASSKPRGLVADFFCGSGTTPVVASRLGRKFIAVDDTFRAVHTTRTRLVAAGARPFRLDRADSAQLEYSTATIARVKRERGRLCIQTRRALDYWEVDPDWDGNLFRSAAQAARPIRNGEIAMEMKIKTGRRICIRFVTVDGKRFQSVIE